MQNIKAKWPFFPPFSFLKIEKLISPSHLNQTQPIVYLFIMSALNVLVVFVSKLMVGINLVASY